MFISWNWLNRHVDLSGLDPREVGHLFTLHVAELDGIEPVGQHLADMRTVRIESVAPVEGSDKLTHVVVEDGDRSYSVVCGAPNARDAVGRVAVLAPAGSTLPDGKAIGRATIRGVDSEGMLASEKELGLGDEHAGIWLLGEEVEPGRSLPEAVPVADWVWEVDNKSITHRPDLWGHYGIAREVALLTDRALRPLEPKVTFGSQDRLSARVDEPDLCPRYTCAYFTGVTIAPSPEWLRALLRATGVRPISNVVDLTNFVMMDAGNPLHAFDARFVANNEIIVRRAADGEIMRTLDGQDRPCTSETLLICDAERPVALAGVMGGENSEIRDDTAEVILESANFDPRNVRRTSARLGLRTESSARFEKALDPANAALAARCFAHLMVELIDGCRAVSPLIDIAAPTPPPTVIALDPAAVSTRLGVHVPVERTRKVLTGLGFGVEGAGQVMSVTVPTWRATKDVAIEEDLIEEVGRIHGYQNIPPKAPRVAVQSPRLSAAKAQERAVRAHLSHGWGMHETMSYAFTWRPMLEKLGADLGGRLEMANAISAELDLMRRSLVPNLLNFAERNARYFGDFGLYEIGRVFTPVPGSLPNQNRWVGIVIAHSAASLAPARGELTEEKQWREARGVAESLLVALGVHPDSARASFSRPTADEIGFRSAWIHPARSTILRCDGEAAGYVTLLHPVARRAIDVSAPVSLIEIDLDTVLAGGAPDRRYAPLSRYPAIGFDVSFEVANEVTTEQVGAAIREGIDSELLRSCQLFFNYHLENGAKSVSFHLEFRADDRSLEDTEVHTLTDHMIAEVTKRLGATLRGG